MPFLAGLNKIFKRIVKMAKSCFAESIELKKKLERVDEDRKTLIRDNDELKWSKEYLEQELDEKNERIYELEESEFMLGYLRRFIKDEDYEKIVEMGKEERENKKEIQGR